MTEKEVCNAVCEHFRNGKCCADESWLTQPPLCEVLDWEDLEEMAKLNNDEYIWQNKYTGEIFTSLFKAIISAFLDFKHYPTCRTLQVFNIGRIEE